MRLKGEHDVRKSLREIAVKAVGMPGFSMAGGLPPGLEHTAHFTPEHSTYSNGTHVAEVEVDIETGAVKIVRYTVAHDCGRVINPMVVDGQVIGGVAHGIGNALFERMVYDENAQPVSMNFGEYLLPLATDVPRVDLVHLETPSPLNPLGIKGRRRRRNDSRDRGDRERGRERARSVWRGRSPKRRSRRNASSSCSASTRSGRTR